MHARVQKTQTADVPFFPRMCSDPTARVLIRRMPIVVTDRRSPIIATLTMSPAQTGSLHALDVIVTEQEAGVVDGVIHVIAARLLFCISCCAAIFIFAFVVF
jgi:hypothetical protein